jgi:hypothetical protein
MAEDLKNIATVEREARLEGKNMFMILAPRQQPLGPPKFTSPHEKQNGETTSEKPAIGSTSSA